MSKNINISLKRVNTDNESRRPYMTKSITEYLNEIRRTPVPSEMETNQLFSVIKNGTKKEASAARDKLVTGNQRFVYALAKRYTSDTDLIMDLVQEGNVGLLLAINTFEPDRGFKFLTYAVHYIRRQMVVYLTNTATPIQKPNSNKTAHIVPRIKREFMVTEEREPTNDEILDILNEEYDLNITELSDILDLSMISIDSEYTTKEGQTITADKNSDFTNATCSHNLYEKKSDEESNKFLADAYLSNLTPRERDILERYFGINHEYPQEMEMIATDYNLSKERVRQIIEESLSYLKKLSFSRQF